MAKKAGSRHLKRVAAPAAWKVRRKDYVWIAKPVPGPHSIEESVPLAVAIKDMLGLCATSREAERIIKQGNAAVDGRAVLEPRFPLGFMDVLGVAGRHYRVAYDKKSRIAISEISAKEAGFKLCRVENKTMTGGKKLQLNLHDGRNLLVAEDKYGTGDVLKVSLPEQKITDHYRLEKGAVAYITGGTHAGRTAQIVEIQAGTLTREPLVVMEKEGESFITPKGYVFVVGRDKPVISVSS